MKDVLFISEASLGHESYLPPMVDWLDRHPELGIRPTLVRVPPLTGSRAFWGNLSLRGLRRWGLDLAIWRWRAAASLEVRRHVAQRTTQTRFHAMVVNTQSLALCLEGLQTPLLVALDATFQQLADSPWFAPNAISRRLLPWTGAWLFRRERRLFQNADHLLPWSEHAAKSLKADYGIPDHRLHVLPPSVDTQLCQPLHRKPARNLLFVGNDYVRKGGPLLLEAFPELSKDHTLTLLTEDSRVPENLPGIRLVRDARRGSQRWQRAWREADLLVFPSSLETYGIVLVEAMAFGVPALASRVGAAEELIGKNERGVLLESPSNARQLASRIRSLLDDAARLQAMGQGARQWAIRHHAIEQTTGQLANLLKGLQG